MADISARIDQLRERASFLHARDDLMVEALEIIDMLLATREQPSDRLHQPVCPTYERPDWSIVQYD